MATSKTLELSIKIAGRMDKSLTAAINGTQSKIGSLTKSISNIGTVGLATMGAVATAAAVGIAGCTKEAQALESAMAPVVRYVDGLADASGAVSDAIADNGKTFKQNYGALKTYIQDLTVTPEINAFIEAAVKELDLAEKNAIGEIGKIFSDAEQTPQN